MHKRGWHTAYGILNATIVTMNINAFDIEKKEYLTS